MHILVFFLAIKLGILSSTIQNHLASCLSTLGQRFESLGNREEAYNRPSFRTPVLAHTPCEKALSTASLLAKSEFNPHNDSLPPCPQLIGPGLAPFDVKLLSL